MVRVSQPEVPKTVRGAVRTRWERALKCSASLINEQLTPVQRELSIRVRRGAPRVQGEELS